MNTSLASSPVLPIVMAGVAGLLIFGTLQSTSTASPDTATEDPGGYVPVELPGAASGAGGEVTSECKANACTITFPAEGGSVKVLGTTVTATKFYGDGITLTVGATPLTSNLSTTAKGGGFTTKSVSVGSGTTGPHTVKVTKNK